MLAGTRGGVAGWPGARSVPAWISRDSAENTSVIGAEKCYSTICEHTGTISSGRADRQGNFGQRGGGRPRRAARSRDQLPAVRELAAQLGVSPTTVAAAY